MSGTASPMTLVDIYVAPKSLFEQFKAAKKYSWIALVLMLALSAGSAFMFYNGMSPEWLIEQQMQTLPADMSPAEREAAEGMIAQTTGSMGIMSSVGMVIATMVFTAIFAGYYMLASKAGGQNRQPLSYGDWFSFSIWTQMPMLINTLGFIALFATAATGDLPMSLPNYASLNQLVLGIAPGEHLYAWAEALNLFSLWTVVLCAIGLKQLADMSAAKAYLLALLPNLLIFGIWFAVA